jgi:hypothetical protein
MVAFGITRAPRVNAKRFGIFSPGTELRSNVCSWWASHPAEPINGNGITSAFGGVRFDPEKGWTFPKGAIHPPEKGPKLARFKLFPNELTEAHVLPFIPEGAKIDQKKTSGLAPLPRS